VGFVLLDDATLAILSFVPFYAVSNMYVGPLGSTVQNLAAPSMRSTASALLLLILNLVGLGAGPILAGVLNDQLAAEYGALAVRQSLLIVALVGGLASVCFWIGSRSLRRDLAAPNA
jgi:hypothetical protein